MARQIINNGTVAGDNTGEILFTAFEKTNDNFQELYSVTGWASYKDDEYTDVAPLDITTISNIPNNSAVVFKFKIFVVYFNLTNFNSTSNR